MYRSLIRPWIENLKKEEFIKYLKQYNFWKSNEETDILYQFLKKDWEKIYDGNIEIFEQIKKQVSEDTYQNLYNLYISTKKKYHF